MYSCDERRLVQVNLGLFLFASKTYTIIERSDIYD